MASISLEAHAKVESSNPSLECHSTCATCAKPDECLTCVTGLLLSVEDNKCYTSCGEGLFQNGI